MNIKFLDHQVVDAVKASKSLAEVARLLGMGRSGSNNALLKKKIERLNLDTSHFTGQAWTRGGQSPNRKSARDVLVNDQTKTQRTKGSLLKRSLVKIGRPYLCENCNNNGTWLEKELTLTVDHIDGDFLNNLPENLRFLCPNCHSQTETYGYKSTK